MEAEEIGAFIKAGSIIARKYIRRLSALQTLQDDFMLDIYITQDSKLAKGQLYLDDGETFNHATKQEYSLIEFSYVDGLFFIKTPHSNYRSGQSFIIDEVNIFGVRYPPRKVLIRSEDMSAHG